MAKGSVEIYSSRKTTPLDIIEYQHAFNQAGNVVGEMGEGHCVAIDTIERARNIYDRILTRYVDSFPALCIFEEQIEQQLIQGLFCRIDDEELLSAAAVVRAHADFLYKSWVGKLSPEAARMLRVVRRLSFRMKSLVALQLAQRALGRPIKGFTDPPLDMVRQYRSQLEHILNRLGTS